MGVPSALLGGFGIALAILVWSELYSCLNPLRVALYYSASIAAGALVLYVYRGFMLPWLFAMTALLPAEDVDDFQEKVTELSAGTVEVLVEEERFQPGPP